MDYLSALLILSSVVLSSGRNILSKGVSEFQFGTKNFFLAQCLLFLGGSTAVLLTQKISFSSVAPITVVYALIYGILLILTQWCYTAALSGGNVAICATVYSLGFIFPTLSGVMFWDEQMNFLNALGVLCVIPAVIISGLKPSNNANKTSYNNYLIPLIIAMFSAGGLGIMQKIQQNSLYAEQKPEFVLGGFVFASAASFACFVFAKSTRDKNRDTKLFMSAVAGACFGGCNLLNTTLAGRLDSAVFFPVYNISVILLSTILSFVIFKEKMSKKDFLVFSLGVVSILLLNL